jgi:chemotaxis protein CheD
MGYGNTMTDCATMDSKDTMVGMSQVAVARAPERLWSILGSCVGVSIFDPKRQVGALGHIVLPAACGREDMPGKFADTAIPYMLDLLKKLGVSNNSLVAKIAGGARMFGRSMPMDIGENNVHTIVGSLAKFGIELAARDIGGEKGRRVTLDCESGELLIEIMGNPPLIL